MEFVINVAIMMTPAIILIAVAICMVEENERYERFLDEGEDDSDNPETDDDGGFFPAELFEMMVDRRKMERYMYDD